MAHRVVIADPLSEEGLSPLIEARDVEVIILDEVQPEAMSAVLAEARALIVRSRTKVTKDLLQKMPRLQVIGRAGVGIDNIDVEQATARGIIVLNAPDGNTIAASEHTMAMMLALIRHIPFAHQTVKSGGWQREHFIGIQLAGKTLGIVGLGRIGQEVAKRARAFEMQIIAYDPFLTEERARALHIEKVSLSGLYARADLITLHTPLTAETRGLINRHALMQMKDGVRIINCARGGIIDEEALLEALESGKVAGAALDVFAEEPPQNRALIEHPRLVVTPHLGASTVEAQTLVARDVALEVLHVLRDEPFQNSVNFPSLPKDMLERLKDDLALAEWLGRLAAQLARSAPKELSIQYAGAYRREDQAALSRALVMSVLREQLDVHVNFVNAFYLAKERALTIQEETSSKSEGFERKITVRLSCEEGASITLSGTVLNGLGPRLVRIDDNIVDWAPTPYTLYVHHHDRPGVIGRVGTMLGEHGINIATMQVGRRGEGGAAIMLIAVDERPGEDVLSALTTLPEIEHVQLLKEK
ncbi:MAG: phosphoglycerate dehydrogenase [Candidatus Carbobacillus altaicus]|nr:phosphoglycerate dehydrogenase [Candidatus Carbobacillus altaicus]